MTGSYFRGDAEAVLAPADEARFDTVTYTYYEQLNGYEYLKQLDIGYFFYSGPYVDDILNVLDPAEKTIIHIPNVNSRESTKDKMREVEHLIEALGEWQGIDVATGFQRVKRPDGRVLRIADLVDDDAAKRDRVSAVLKNPAQKSNRDAALRTSPSCAMSAAAPKNALPRRSPTASPARTLRRSSRCLSACRPTSGRACANPGPSRPATARLRPETSSSSTASPSTSPRWASR
jgi:hypothetical protein